MRFARALCCLPAILCGIVPALHAQQRNDPRVGYVFPAGAQRGSVVEIKVGGQFLEGTQAAIISGSGVRVTLIRYDRPLPMKRFNELRDYLEETRKKYLASNPKPAELGKFGKPERIATILKEAGATDEEIQKFLERRKQFVDPKRQQNLQISENVILQAQIAPDAAPGARELRLLTSLGASNPLSFCVGSLPEQTGFGAAGETVDTASRVALPAVLNGWIPPGGVHHYSFQARRGAQLVIAVQARDLIPYLADAVPGWFQPVTALYDSKGRQVAYADHFRFNPDPVLCYDVPRDDVYLLEIRDSLFRGREDFVYRVTAGEVPFVTDIFPLGGGLGVPSTVELAGWNLPQKKVTLMPLTAEGIHPVPAFANGLASLGTVFETDSLPEIMKAKPGDEPARAQPVSPPVVVNGRIDSPGEVDVFEISCRAGENVVAETFARRLNSPLDSWLKVTDASGRQLAFNDDCEDKGAGLLTHCADSRLTFTAPASGSYYIHLGDAQGKGGPEYAYRLRISPPMPDFALRMVPSCINARPGAIVPVTLYALRKDGFNGDITVNLTNVPSGFRLDGGCIPAGQDNVRATLTIPQGPAPTPSPVVPRQINSQGTGRPSPAVSLPPVAGSPPATSPAVRPLATGAPASSPPDPSRPLASATPSLPAATPVPVKTISLAMEGRASIGGRSVTRPVVPADDRMQAFIYHHLVPTKEFLAVISGLERGRMPINVVNTGPVKLLAGGPAQSILALTGGRPLFAMGETILQLSDPPDGISIEGYSPVSAGTAISFKADPAKVKSGLRGNLIVEAFVERTPVSKDGKVGEKRRYSIGYLPAIPFEVVSTPAVVSSK
jgi:hypothetical protein